MNESRDTIDRMLHDHLRRELDPYVGVASRRFAEQIGSQSAVDGPSSIRLAGTSPAPVDRRGRTPNFGSGWSIGLVGAALAATLTIVSMRNTTPINAPGRNASPNLPGGESTQVHPVSGRANIAWQTYDQGIVELSDGSLARRYLQESTNRVTCVDPRTKRTYEYIEPRAQTVLVKLNQH